MAEWQSGHAADCKSVHAGSIPTSASLVFMLSVKINNLDEAARFAVSQLIEFSKNKEVFTLCLTGGWFGESFAKRLDFIKDSRIKFNFLLSDERLVNSKDKNSNAKLIKKCLAPFLKTLKSDTIFFNTDGDHISCFENLKSRLHSKNILRPDFLVLSLGKDGHLAGHFHNSTLDATEIFCYTHEAPKPISHRVSFSIKWLSGSKQIILAAIGEEKKYELEKLKNGTGLHSNLMNHPNLIILS